MEYPIYKNIVSNPDICNGKPIIKGTRITVKAVIRFSRKKDKNILSGFPRMTAEDLQACKEFNSMFFEKPYLMKTIKA
jgi:uncharacterized protein (DUF433 family)